MADKLLISDSATQVSIARWHGGRFGRCDVFENSDVGLTAFKDHLGQIRSAPVHMMVDAVEEDYRFESLPHSFGGERTEMVNRKLKQHYRNSPYCSARMQGRDTGKRRDDRYLFCALTNPDLIAAWVQAVNERGLPIAGIYLLPTVSQGLVEKLEIKHVNLLVVSIHSSGTRLTFFREQKLRVSRLARIDLGGPQAIKGYAEEISNTRLYLHAMRVMTLDEQLSLLIVDREDTLKELAQAIGRDNPNIECRRLTRQEIVTKIGLPAAALDSSSAALYLYLMGLRAPDSNLAPATLTQTYRQHQTRRGIHALTAVTAIAAATWCAINLYQIFDTRSEAEAARRQTLDLQAQYQEATRQFPAAPTSAENLRRAVEISQQIGTLTRVPETMMHVVGQALETNPSIILKVFGWKYGRGEIESGGGTAKPATGGGESGAPATAAGSRRQSGLINGEVRPFRGDFRESLTAQPEVAEVRVVKLPLNISPGLTLSGNTTDDHREQTGKAEFKLLLVLKQPL